MGCWWRRRERNLSRKSWPSFARSEKAKGGGVRGASCDCKQPQKDDRLSLDTKTLSGKWCRAATGWPTEYFVYMPDVEPTPKRSACASRWVPMAPRVQFLKLSETDSLVQISGRTHRLTPWEGEIGRTGGHTASSGGQMWSVRYGHCHGIVACRPQVSSGQSPLREEAHCF